MCVLIVKSHNDKVIPREALANCRNLNRDGMGIAYAHHGKLSVYKELTDFDKFLAKYHEAERRGAEIMLHFRIATHGAISKENCHPFWVANQLVVGHNGTLNVRGAFSHRTREEGTLADTILFNRLILRPLYRRNPDFLKSAAVLSMLDNYVGTSNKLAFLDIKGDFKIINEAAGEWVDDAGGAWFSNKSYERSNITVIRRDNRGYCGGEDWFGSAEEDDVICLGDRKPGKGKAERKMLPSGRVLNVQSTKSKNDSEHSTNDTKKADTDMSKAEAEVAASSDDAPGPPHDMGCACMNCQMWRKQNGMDYDPWLDTEPEAGDHDPFGILGTVGAPDESIDEALVLDGCVWMDRIFCYRCLPTVGWQGTTDLLLKQHAKAACSECGRQLTTAWDLEGGKAD
jgi:hypothetical protein